MGESHEKSPSAVSPAALRVYGVRDFDKAQWSTPDQGPPHAQGGEAFRSGHLRRQERAGAPPASSPPFSAPLGSQLLDVSVLLPGLREADGRASRRAHLTLPALFEKSRGAR